MERKYFWWLVGGLLFASLIYAAAEAEPLSRVKDLAALDGNDSEPLLGYGLVVGLNGTGDGPSTEFTVNSLAAMLERLGVSVPQMICSSVDLPAPLRPIRASVSPRRTSRLIGCNASKRSQRCARQPKSWYSRRSKGCAKRW